MYFKQPTAALIALTYLSQTTAFAAKPKEAELRWSELAPLITGQEVSLVLPGKVRVRGEVLTIRPDALAMQIKKTSAPRVQAKGPASIPRSAISVVELRKMRQRGRIIGTISGFFVGMTAAVVATSVRSSRVRAWSNEAQGAFTIATVAGMAALGYYLGHYADQNITVIRIIPDEMHRPAEKDLQSGGAVETDGGGQPAPSGVPLLRLHIQNVPGSHSAPGERSGAPNEGMHPTTQRPGGG